MKKSKYLQGLFTPQNPQKYLGNQKPFFRSSLELKFMSWCDKNNKVIKWGSENVVIPYYNELTKRTHRYFVDNFIIFKDGDNLVKYLIEIKPRSQTVPPTTNYSKKSHLIYEQKRYIQNMCKWKHAEMFAKKHNCKFLILTEEELGKL